MRLYDMRTSSSLGKWGRMHRIFLMKEKPDVFSELVRNGSLDRYLQDINCQAQERMNLMMKQGIAYCGMTEEAGSDGMGTSDEYDPAGSRRNREGRNHLLLRWHDESDPINVENRTDSDGHDCDGDPVGRVFPARCFFHRLSSDCRIVPDDLSAVLFDGDLHRIGVDSDDAHRICD